MPVRLPSRASLNRDALLAGVSETGLYWIQSSKNTKKQVKTKGVQGLDAQTDRIRLSADVGGTFTDVAAFDEPTGEFSLGKTLTTPARLVDGIENGVGKAGTTLRRARLFLHGTTVAINTILERTGAQMRAAHHAGLPRHLRDRPRQPAGILQSVLPEASSR